MKPPVDQIESILAAAVEIADAAQRRAFVEEACAGDAEVKDRVEQLIDNHFQAGSFLEAPASHLAATAAEVMNERPGTIIGPYKLLEQIGEGGFGIVFMAEQQQPIRRKVALKVLKPGMDTRQVIARFEAERQALALMDHPNIAKVLEGGQTTSGRPYFVMDLVKGVPITEFCDQSQLTPKERLELFVHVCQAVQHAHQKGIIHRDIKPTNVLVTMQDGAPLVKVIDFGIAKALGQQLTDKTLFTAFAQMIGTPLYMAPEQAVLSNVDADTRSDIYSLGVLLYELLTGTTPFDKERFKEAGYDEIRRIIREEEPPRPSTRISTMGQAATSMSTQRKSDPKRLSQIVRGELDWIVMKCLEKDRNRRYETANSLARDIGHYLHNEPVQACPPSKLYRLRKFTRRNARALAAAGTGAALVVMGLLLTAVLLAVHAGELKEEQEGTYKENVRAERALAQAEVNLRRADQNLGLALEALDDVYMKEEGGLIGDLGMTSAEPESLQQGLEFYEQFAQQNSGYAQLERVTAKAYRRAATLRLDLGHRQEAEAHLARAIAVFEKLSDELPDNTDIQQELALCRGALASADEKDRKRADALTKVIEERPNDPAAWIARGRFWVSRFQNDRAAEDFLQAFKLGVDDAPLLLEGGRVFLWVGYHDRALAVAKRLLEVEPGNVHHWHLLGQIRFRTRDWKAAIAAMHKAIEVSNGTSNSWQWFYLAMANWQLGEKDRARRWCQQAIRSMEKNDPRNKFLQRLRADAMGVLGLPEGSVLTKQTVGHDARGHDDVEIYTLVLESDPAATWARAMLKKLAAAKPR